MRSASYRLSHLDSLKSGMIHVMREVAAERERPTRLFSGGKDSAVLLCLAEKAFRPGRFPFRVMHVDNGHNYPEALEFRDRRMGELGERLVVASVQESLDVPHGQPPVPCSFVQLPTTQGTHERKLHILPGSGNDHTRLCTGCELTGPFLSIRTSFRSDVEPTSRN